MNLRRCLSAAITTTLAGSFLALVAAAPALAGGPANDNFADATTLTLPGGLSGSNMDATTETNEPDHEELPFAGSSVWFKWTATFSGTVTLDTCIGPASFSTQIKVYADGPAAGTAVSDLVPVAEHSPAPIGCTSIVGERIAFTASSGSQYFIAIDSYTPDQEGTYKLVIESDAQRYLSTPVILGATPPSGSNSPMIYGTSDLDTYVNVFSNPACTMGVGDDGPAATFASPGLTQAVVHGETVTFYAQATDWDVEGGHYSLCSAGLTYTGPALPKNPPVDPKRKKKKKKKKKKRK